MSGWLQSSRIFFRDSGKWSLALQERSTETAFEMFPLAKQYLLGPMTSFLGNMLSIKKLQVQSFNSYSAFCERTIPNTSFLSFFSPILKSWFLYF